MPLMFGHTSNLALKLFLSSMLALTFVQLLKYAPIVNRVNRLTIANMSPTPLMVDMSAALDVHLFICSFH